MCGICGVFFDDPKKKIEESVLVSMRDAMALRGPDDSGLYLKPGIGLGHRRLSIIDLADGHQPMTNEDETLWLVYNGEIYNFQELRPALEAKGHTFKTHSDSEVILHAYEEYGPECVHHFNGMFAFAIYDKKDHSLFLARDRLGVKPLYYFYQKGMFAFASSLKALLKHSDIPLHLDKTALNEYLLFEYVPAPLSMIQNLFKLLPGHWAKVSRGKMAIEKYWDLNYRDKDRRPFPELKEELRELMKASVKRRLISDVPLGIFLSGGIDSSTILSLMTELGHAPLKTFSIGFNETSFNELDYARKVAKHFSTDHSEMMVTPQSLIDLFPKVLQGIDDPVGDPSAAPTYLVSQLARKSVTVCLAGDGGDELFAGYPTYQALKIWKLYSLFPRPIQKLISHAVFKMPTSFRDISLDYKLKKFMEGIPFPIEQANFLWKGAFRPQEKNAVLTAAYQLHGNGYRDYQSLEPYLKSFNGKGLLDKLLCLDTHVYMQDDILVKVDGMSMANSLEVRVPFLDYTVAEFAAKLPESFKLKGFQPKYILKESMKGSLPADILRRKKKGFGIPFAVWVAEALLKNFVLDFFTESQIREEGIFNFEQVKQILDDHFAQKRDNRKLIWTLLVFIAWYREVKNLKSK